MNVKFDTRKSRIFRGVYRPDAPKFLEFLELMEDLPAFLKTLKHDCIIFRDFNIDTLIVNYEQKFYRNLLAAYGFSIKNTSSTRVTSTKLTCLDHVVTFVPVETETVQFTINDHYTLEASITPVHAERKYME